MLENTAQEESKTLQTAHSGTLKCTLWHALKKKKAPNCLLFCLLEGTTGASGPKTCTFHTLFTTLYFCMPLLPCTCDIWPDNYHCHNYYLLLISALYNAVGTLQFPQAHIFYSILIMLNHLTTNTKLIVLNELSTFKYIHGFISDWNILSAFPSFHAKLIKLHRTDLEDSRGHTMPHTLVYRVRKPLEAPLFQERQKGILEHWGATEHHRGQSIIRVSQAVSRWHYRVIPANL